MTTLQRNLAFLALHRLEKDLLKLGARGVTLDQSITGLLPPDEAEILTRDIGPFSLSGFDLAPEIKHIPVL